MIEKVNLSAARMLGWDRGKLIGKWFSHLICKEDQDIYYLHRREILNSQSKKTCDLSLVRKDETLFYGHLESILAMSEQSDSRHLRIAVMDITETRQAQKDREKALIEARQKELEQEALFKATKVVLQQYDRFDNATGAIFKHLRNLLGVEGGYVALLNEDGDENEVVFLDSGKLTCTLDSNLPIPIQKLRAKACRNMAVVYEK